MVALPCSGYVFLFLEIAILGECLSFVCQFVCTLSVNELPKCFCACATYLDVDHWFFGFTEQALMRNGNYTHFELKVTHILSAILLDTLYL